MGRSWWWWLVVVSVVVIGVAIVSTPAYRGPLIRTAATTARGLLWLLSRQRLPPRPEFLQVLIPPDQLPFRDPHISIQWDDHGFPHILADDPAQAVFALGFCHAQDRLFQLDFFRKLARARLHEMLGAALLPLDRIFFDLQFEMLAEREVQRQQPGIEQILQAYVAGINAYLHSAIFRLPIEYVLIRPSWTTLMGRDARLLTPFTVEDVYATVMLTSFIMSRGGEHEIVRALKVSSGAPRELLAELLSFDQILKSGQVMHLPEGIQWNDIISSHDELTQVFVPAVGGSNAWVVGPTLTDTGRPLVAGDPHLMSTAPSPWYGAHLRTRDGAWNVHGLTNPGMPFVMIGHSETIAWSVTLSFADTLDYFVEQVRAMPADETAALDPQHPPQYLFQGAWQNLQIRQRQVTVGDRHHVFTAFASHHGPLLSTAHHQLSLTDKHPHLFSTDRALSLATNIHNSLASKLPILTDRMLSLHSARDLTEWRSALLEMALSLNVVFADVHGNFGYQLTGRIPIRHNITGGPLVPAEGWTGTGEWLRFIPPSELPGALNPLQPFVVSANHRQVGPDDYPHYISDFYAASGVHRGARAEAILKSYVSSAQQVTREVLSRMHRDITSPVALKITRQLLPYWLAIDSAESRLFSNYLQEWDGTMQQAQVAPSLFHAFMYAFMEVLFEPIFQPYFGNLSSGTSCVDLIRGKGIYVKIRPVTEFIGRDHSILSQLLDAAMTNSSALLHEAGGIRKVITDATIAAATELSSLLGSDPRSWQWGRLHALTWVHPLGRQSPLNMIFNMGPYPVDVCAIQTFVHQIIDHCRAFSLSRCFQLERVDRSAILGFGRY